MKVSKIPVYLMPGMGAGPKIFKYLKFPDAYEVYYMHWLVPTSFDETLEEYTSRLVEQIKHKNPILFGVSFGGIIIQEMTKQIPVKKLIIVSSIKSHTELPPFYQLVLKTHLYKLFPANILQNIDWLKKIAPTKKFKQKMNFYQNYMEINDPLYIRWAMAQVLSWQQTQKLSNFVHIAGEKDPIFPPKYIKAPKIVIPKGRHDMIIYQSKWFNKHMDKILET